MFRFRSMSDDDLATYRQHYPKKRKDDPDANDNVLFYRNEIPGPSSLRIDEFHEQKWAKYDWLEYSHSFIQWIFPIQEPGLNPDAQVLMRHEITAMRADPAIMRRVWKSFQLMLDFYGMRVDIHDLAKPPYQSTKKSATPWRSGADGSKVVLFQVQRHADANVCRDCYYNLNTSPHNYLRITRILKCLGELLLEDVKIAWLVFLAQEVFVTRALRNCARSLTDFWAGTIYDDDDRGAFAAWCRDISERNSRSSAATKNTAAEQGEEVDEVDEVSKSKGKRSTSRSPPSNAARGRTSPDDNRRRRPREGPDSPSKN